MQVMKDNLSIFIHSKMFLLYHMLLLNFTNITINHPISDIDLSPCAFPAAKTYGLRIPIADFHLIVSLVNRALYYPKSSVSKEIEDFCCRPFLIFVKVILRPINLRDNPRTWNILCFGLTKADARGKNK